MIWLQDPILTKHKCKDVSNLFISATQTKTKHRLINIIEDNLNQFKTEMTFTIPFNQMQIYNILHKKSHIIETENSENGIIIKCHINKILGAKIMNQLHSSKD